MRDSDGGDLPTEEAWIVPRSPNVIQLLSPEFRWEFTRRHPYYLMLWQQAQSRGPDATERDRLVTSAAQLILQDIGVADQQPPPPSLSHSELDEQPLETQWRDGAISPVQVRALVAMLSGPMLPADTKRAIAGLLLRSADLDPSDTGEAYNLVRDITQGQYPNFDLCLPSLIVTINPQAPQRAIAQAVEHVVREYKTAHAIPEQRRRDENLDEYLAVWDLREGWTGSEYDCSREQRFKEIAGRLEIPIQTAASRYRSAFKIVVGQEYSAHIWWKVVGFPKMAGLLGTGLPRIAASRPSRKRQPREVPESVISGTNSRDERRFLQNAGMRSDDIEQLDLLMDIQTLVRRGLSDDKIVENLGLDSEHAVEMIRYLRDPHREPL